MTRAKDKHFVEWPNGWVTAMALMALTAYPVGAAMIGFSSAAGGVIIGYVLLVAAVAATIALSTSTHQNMIWGDPDRLDEYQLRLRSRAIGMAYLILTVLTLCATLFAGVSADAGWWHPSAFGEYNAVFWGFMLYAIVLPTLCLAWQSDSADGAEG